MIASYNPHWCFHCYGYIWKLIRELTENEVSEIYDIAYGVINTSDFKDRKNKQIKMIEPAFVYFSPIKV